MSWLRSRRRRAQIPYLLNVHPTRHLYLSLEDPSHSTGSWSPSSGHPGLTVCIQLLSNKFWWSTLRTDIIVFIKNCVTCNTSKSSKQMPAGLLQPLPIPQRPWSHIAIDFITDLPNSKAIPPFSQSLIASPSPVISYPYPNYPQPWKQQRSYAAYVIRFYGLPDDIVSDRGPVHLRVWTAFFRFLNVNISLTSGYHPESNGQTERFNQEVTRFLRSYCHRNQADWSRYLSGQNMHKIRFARHLLDSHLSNVYLDSNHLSFHGPGNPQNYLQSITG